MKLLFCCLLSLQLAVIVTASCTTKACNKIEQTMTDRPLEPMEPIPIQDTKESKSKDSQIMTKIEEDLNEIKTVLVANREDAIRREAPEDIVRLIRSRNMKLAYEKLQKLNDPYLINWIVKEVYDYRIENYDLVIEFCTAVDSPDIELGVYRALVHEMFEMIRNPSIGNNWLNRMILDFEKAEKKYSIDYPDVRNKTRDIILQAFLEIPNIIESITNYVKFLKRNDIKVAAYKKLYPKILLAENKDDNLMQFVQAVKELNENPEFKTDDPQRAILQTLINSFPKCLRVAYFNNKVYIENVKYKKYLYASSNLKNQENREKWRAVYSKPIKTYWSMKILIYDGIAIRNLYGEYLYSQSSWDDSSLDTKDKEVYSVYGINYDISRNSHWTLVTKGDQCFIENKENKARLYVSDDEKHSVSSKKGNFEDDDAFLFNIEPAREDDAFPTTTEQVPQK